MADNSLRPLKGEDFDYWKAQHLLNRAGFGGTPGQVRALTRLGLAKAVDHLVDYASISADPVERDEFDRHIMRPRTMQERQEIRRARRSGDEATVERVRRERQKRQQADRRQMAEIQQWWLKRLIESARPLEEKMTLFWHGHFATGYRAIEDSYHMFMQNQLFRAHAAGNFRALTHAIIRDPAMLRYLNNNQNRKERPNENLARELMELFTLGEGHDYTEDDIKEGARALTGYTYIDDQPITLDSPAFRRLHDHGEKRILGQVGRWDGDDFVDIIFTRNACSQFICWKLYRFFVNDTLGTPDEAAQAFILDLAELLRREDYELKPVLKALFKSRHFYAPRNTASLIKSPIQLIVQAIRSLRTPTRQLSALLAATGLMGQSIFQPPNVKGWTAGRTWINTSTLFVRQNLMVYLLSGKRPNLYDWQLEPNEYDPSGLIEHLRHPDEPLDVTEAVTYLLRFNLGTEPQPERVAALVSFVQERGGEVSRHVLIDLLELITAMPEYQLC